jgi:two-component system chemotaxis response regulator CheY
MRIMLVDDDKMVRKILGLYLHSVGHEVVYAENGLDAIEKLLLNDVDLLLTDMHMPYMDGIELTKTIKSNANLKNIPIVMMTEGQGDSDNGTSTAECINDCGADSYVEKPVTACKVGEAINKFKESKE